MKKHENYELCKKWCAPPAVLGRVPPRRGHGGGAHDFIYFFHGF
jgi:hypothetical protein